MEKVAKKPITGVKPVKRPSISSNIQKPVTTSRKASTQRKNLGIDNLHPKSITATVAKVNQTTKNVSKIFKAPSSTKNPSQIVSKSKRNSISSTISNTPKKPVRQLSKSSPPVRNKESGASNINAKPPYRPKLQRSRNEVSERPAPIKKESSLSQSKVPKVVPKAVVAPKKQTSAVKPTVNEPNQLAPKKRTSAVKTTANEPNRLAPKKQTSAVKTTVNEPNQLAPRKQTSAVKTTANEPNMLLKKKPETIAPAPLKASIQSKPNKVVENPVKIPNEIENKLKIDFSKIKEIEPDVNVPEEKTATHDTGSSVLSSDLLTKKSPNVDVALDSINIPAAKTVDKKEIIDIKLPPQSNIPVLEKPKPVLAKKAQESDKPVVKKAPKPYKPALKKTAPVKKMSDIKTTNSLDKKPKVEIKKVRKIPTKKSGLKTINESLADSDRLRAAVAKLAKEKGKTAAEIRERRKSNLLKLIEKKKMELRAQKKEKAQEERLITASPTQPIN